MSKRKLDWFLAILSRHSGKSTEDLLMEFELLIRPKLKSPEKLYQEISDVEYEYQIAMDQKHPEIFLEWAQGGFDMDKVPFEEN